MKKLIIVGAGGFGRELAWWIDDINEVNKTWDVLGFIDDDLHALDSYQSKYKVIGKISDWKVEDDQVFALAIASSELKMKITKELKHKGAQFASIIHPTAKVSEFAEYGEGLVMFPYSKLSCNSKVGDFVTILSSMIGHDTFIGDFTTISGGCNIVRNVKIGKRVFLAAGVCIAQVLNVGDDAYLGLGAVVLKDVENGSTVFGNPARPVPGIKR